VDEMIGPRIGLVVLLGLRFLFRLGLGLRSGHCVVRTDEARGLAGVAEFAGVAVIDRKGRLHFRIFVVAIYEVGETITVALSGQAVVGGSMSAAVSTRCSWCG